MFTEITGYVSGGHKRVITWQKAIGKYFLVEVWRRICLAISAVFIFLSMNSTTLNVCIDYINVEFTSCAWSGWMKLDASNGWNLFSSLFCTLSSHFPHIDTRNVMSFPHCLLCKIVAGTHSSWIQFGIWNIKFDCSVFAMREMFVQISLKLTRLSNFLCGNCCG